MLALHRIAAIIALAPTVAAAADFRSDQVPPAGTDPKIGADVFAANCSGCHGVDGVGKVGRATRLADQVFLSAASNDFITATVTKGRPATGMIAWVSTDAHSDAGLKKKDVDQVVTLLRTWQTAPGLTLDESPLAGELDRGNRIYHADCEQCHGGEDSKPSEVLSGIQIGHKAYLASASPGYLRATSKRCKDVRKLEAGAALPEAADYPLHYTPDQLDSVFTWLRANAW